MNRARETIFNWLAPHIDDAKCLDLFSGSGALGFEALSRGADHATFVEQNPAIIRALHANRKVLLPSSLDQQRLTIIRASAPAWLSKQEQRWDIIFLDPPFGEPLLEETLQILTTGNYTQNDALIYLETPKPLYESSIWATMKSSKVGGTYLNLISLK